MYTVDLETVEKKENGLLTVIAKGNDLGGFPEVISTRYGDAFYTGVYVGTGYETYKLNYTHINEKLEVMNSVTPIATEGDNYTEYLVPEVISYATSDMVVERLKHKYRNYTENGSVKIRKINLDHKVELVYLY